MQLLVCAVDTAPCPLESQQWLTVEQAFTPGAVGVDAEGVAEVFGWGFGVVIFLWFLGYCIGAGLKVIRLT